MLSRLKKLSCWPAGVGWEAAKCSNGLRVVRSLYMLYTRSKAEEGDEQEAEDAMVGGLEKDFYSIDLC